MNQHLRSGKKVHFVQLMTTLQIYAKLLCMESNPTKPQKPQASARNKLMDLLARRDHSEQELRTKLRRRKFSEEEIDRAISEARDHNWMAPPKEIGEKYAQSLHNKNKGIHYINHQLQSKGLPTLAMDSDLELEKAQRVVENKFPDLKKLDRDDKGRVARLLSARGFDSDTIRKIIF